MDNSIFYDLYRSDIDLSAKSPHIRAMVRDGKSIRAAREALRLRQNKFAAICSIRPETLNRIENGKDRVPGYVDLILALLERDEGAVRFAMERRGL